MYGSLCAQTIVFAGAKLRDDSLMDRIVGSALLERSTGEVDLSSDEVKRRLFRMMKNVQGSRLVEAVLLIVYFSR